MEFEEGEPRRAVMPAEVYLAYMNPQVRQAARRAVAPVERPGIEAVTLRTPIGDPVTVTKAEAANFRHEDPAPPDAKVTRRTARVQPMMLNFNSDSWRVSEGAASFLAKVEDGAYLSRLDEGTVTIGKTDIFEVGLRSEQSTESDGKLKVTHAIERIISQEHGAIQGALDFEATDGLEE